MAAGSAAERAEAGGRKSAAKRGREASLIHQFVSADVQNSWQHLPVNARCYKGGGDQTELTWASNWVQVVMTFSQQGLGNFTNVSVLLILMCCFDTIHPIHGKTPKTYYPKRLEGVWRVSFALGSIPLIFMIYWRVFRLRESAVWVKRTDNVSRKGDIALLFRW